MTMPKPDERGEKKEREIPICRNCGLEMFEIGCMCTNHGSRIYQCPEDKTIAIS